MKQFEKRTKIVVLIAVISVFAVLLALASCSKPTGEVGGTATLTEVYFVPLDESIELDYWDSAQTIPLTAHSFESSVEYIQVKAFGEGNGYDNSAGISYSFSKKGLKLSAERKGEFSTQFIDKEDTSICYRLQVYFCDVKTVTNVTELRAMHEPYTIYRLAGDIDMTGVTWTPYDLYGCFDGCGYSVKNLKIEAPAGESRVGMFATVYGGVKNLTLTDATVSVGGSGEYVGMLAGVNEGALENLSITGSCLAADCDLVGAVVGAQMGRAKNLLINATVTGSRAVGGAFGNVVTTAFEKQTGITFEGSVNGYEWVGGIAGAATDIYNEIDTVADVAYFDNALNKGSVTGTYYVGGIVGYAVPSSYTKTTSSGKGGSSSSTVYDQLDLHVNSSVNEGAIVGVDYVGGLVGAMGVKEKTMTGFTGSCANRSKVKGTYYVGGYVGSAEGVTLEGLTNTHEVEGEAKVGGIAGYAYGIKNSTNEGKIVSTGVYYTGWANTGGVAGSVGDAENCTNRGEVASANGYVGGVFGFVSGSVKGCTNAGNVTALKYVGGVCGGVEGGTAENNKNTGTVLCSADCAGGVFGYLYNSSVVGSVNEGSVTGVSQVGGVVGVMSGGKLENATSSSQLISGSKQAVGGIIGKLSVKENESAPTVTGLASTSNVSGDNRVGGVIGEVDCEITIEAMQCTAQTVQGKSYVGGLVGYGKSATLSNSMIINTAVSGSDHVGGLIGVGKAVISGTFRGRIVIAALSEATDVFVGGIGGQLDFADNCVNYASITVTNGNYVGGIAGCLEPLKAGTVNKIVNCSNKAEINAGDYVGGIAGKATNAYADACINEARITGTKRVAGIFGGAKEVKGISNCVNKSDASITAEEYAAGILGAEVSTNKVTGCRNEAIVNSRNKIGGIVVGDGG